MAGSTLAVLSPGFSTALDRGITRLMREADRAIAHAHLSDCWFEDEHCDCRELATVHQLGTDYSYCLRHFEEAVRRG